MTKGGERPKTILFSTTRSWNIGDEFILLGLRRLITAAGHAVTPVIYNRHPDLHDARIRPPAVNIQIAADAPPQPIDLGGVFASALWRYDNSWRPGHDLGLYDAVIFAGTPEWQGPMVAPLTQALADADVPVAYVGIGGFEGVAAQNYDAIAPADRAVLERAGLITVRDEMAGDILAPLDPVALPCPALFSADTARKRSGPLKIALSAQSETGKGKHPIAKESVAFVKPLFKRLIKAHDCAIVCHYIDDIYAMREMFGDAVPILYSYETGNYADIYDAFNLTVTTRVHGAGICASMGIPGFVIAHSARSGTTDGFMSEALNPTDVSVDDAVKAIEDFNIAKRSADILALKKQTEKKYISLFKAFLDGK